MRARSGSARHGLVVVLVLGMLGCLRDPGVVAWEAQLVAADRALRDGDAARALDAYGALRETAPDDRARIDTEQGRAEALLALGHREEAARAYLAASRSTEDRETRARLVFRAARVVYDQPETQEDGLAAMTRILERYPDTVAGLRSLQYLQQHFGGTPEGRDWLLRFYREHFEALRGSPLADNLIFEAAQIHAARRTPDDDRAALKLLTDLTIAYPRAALWDDALWRLADVQHRLGLTREELGTLQTLVRTREKPMFFGNYETLYYHRGQYRIARLLRDDLGDLPAATEAFEVFVREYPFSKWYDDALFQLAQLYLGAGRADDARAVAERLAKERPESRWVNRTRELVRLGVDPGPPPTWTDPTVPWSYDEGGGS